MAIRKLFKISQSLAVTIPYKEVKNKDLKEGDYINITIEKVIVEQ